MLSTDQIEDRIKNPVSRQILEAGVSIQNAHKVHITGEGFSLARLKSYESADDYSIRVQLTKPATVQLCALILDNLNRWVSNPGTVKLVKFKQQDEQGKAFKSVLNQVWRGRSLEEFIRTFYKEAIYQEMNGFLVVTKPALVDGGMMVREGVTSKYEGGALDPYMIFIAAEDVHDFNSIGDSIEYLIIKLPKIEGDNHEYYRILDDTQDTVVKYDKSNERIVDEKPVLHGVAYTPAIQISSIAKKLTGDKLKTSPIDHVLSALERYARKDSDLIMQMVRHMYPKLASVTTQCLMCDGQGYTYDIETKVACPHCNGTGKVVPISRDGVLGLPQFISEGQTPYPGSPASYITPDVASLQLAIDDLKELAQQIMYSATGDKNIIAESLNTATENLINFKGLEDRISEIVSMVESREEFIIQTVAKMHKDFARGFEGVSVRYGRKLVIRGESEIMMEIKSAKEVGMPISHIEALQRELIYSKYKNNKVELERQLLLAALEPLNGYAVGDIADIKEFVDPEDLVLKYNFNTVIDWFESTSGLIQEYNKDQEWAKRIDAIRQILTTHEVFSIARNGQGDGGLDEAPSLEE